MSEEDDAISKLLRLKRYEQPRPGYFEDFLKEFQQRQRAELLKRPLWRLALDRATTFWSDLSGPRLAYATASVAVVAIATVFTVNMLQAPMETGAPMLAATTANPTVILSPTPRAASPHQVVSAPVTTRGSLSLDNTRLPEPAFPAHPFADAALHQQPRYILDSRPTSYEAPFDF